MKKVTKTAFARMVEEHRKRQAQAHGVAVLSGVILLPKRDPKPEPPPEWWTQTGDTQPEIVNPRAGAEARIKEFLQRKRAE